MVLSRLVRSRVALVGKVKGEGAGKRERGRAVKAADYVGFFDWRGCPRNLLFHYRLKEYFGRVGVKGRSHRDRSGSRSVGLLI